MNQQPTHPLNVPSPVVSNAITFDRRELMATPAEIAADKHRNTWEGALIGGIILAGTGYALSSRGPDRMRNALISSAVGAVGGGVIGHTLKTGVENRSEALQALAQKPNFGSHLKQEMANRERSAFWNGFLAGSCIFL